MRAASNEPFTAWSAERAQIRPDNFPPGGVLLLAVSIHAAVGFMPQTRLIDQVRKVEGLALCGRGTACPG